MKKLFVLCFAFLLAACTKPYVVNPQIYENAINAGYQVVYSPTAHAWSKGSMAEDRIVFTKSVSIGSGNYSQYSAPGRPMIMMPTQYEFLFNGRLIGYSTADLKFYELIFEEGIVRVKELSFAEVKEIFPGLEIIKVSTAENGKLQIKRLPFETKSFMVLNDTDETFYHYSYENKITPNAPFNSLLTVDSYETILFSHFKSRDDMFPILKIKVTF